jgi:class 3 adenylate cyclase
VETIGDCYFCATGVPRAEEDDADRLLALAFSIQARVAEFVTPGQQSPLRMRVGVHSGPSVAGVRVTLLTTHQWQVVGIKMPRYHFFGTNVQIASIMEQKGIPDAVHASASFVSQLTRREGLIISARDDPVDVTATFRISLKQQVEGEHMQTFFIRQDQPLHTVL